MASVTDIESVLKEKRVFPCDPAFAARAHVKSADEYEALYRRSTEDPGAFWAEVGRELSWFEEPIRTLEWNCPDAKWFVGGKLNVSSNCLDRHLTTVRRNQAAIIWEGEPGDTRVLTYQMLHSEVCRFAAALKRIGVHKGDRVAIYLPMIPEAAIAMLACARLGATHSVVFGGFSAEALRDRINDAQARFVITADGGWRRGAVVALKDAVDEAVEETPSVERVVVVKRTGTPVKMNRRRDLWWDELVAGVPAACEAEPVDSEHPLFILYTSGTTGKPKGVVHSTAGYLAHVQVTTKLVFDLKDEDIYWCTADIGWVTGHSYVVYGPLANGATTLMYEGAPNQPQPDRFWEIIERYKVNVLYTAPTAIRTFTRWGDEWPQKHDLSSLRLLGTVGEPINPEAWTWYRRVIGGNRCPIVDTWWQTETGGILISPLPGAVPAKPGSCTKPFPGIVPEVVNRDGKPAATNDGGYLVIKQPWPGMLRTVWGDHARFVKEYWSQVPGMYFTGDGARRDEDGYFWVMGRIDDVVNVSGHRLGTMEIESALVSHACVTEAAVVGRPDEIKGEALAAFVTLAAGTRADDALRKELREHVGKEIGAFAKPDDIRFTEALPKTRSGKIMRRLLRDLAAGKESVGDTTTLEDVSVLAKLREEDE